MTLRQLFPTRLDQQRNVGELGRREAQGLIQQQLAGRAGHVLTPADHVGDAHVVIIYDHGQVIDGCAIGAGKDEVVEL
ncbi:MAG: hypothetical protein O7B29_05620 [Deltaproteobacteria bacterium]|nr:hypothetical protein [Deltaproteobacteria bacterium]